MEILGRVEEITCDGRLIVRCSVLPDIGAVVYSHDSKRVGTVGRVFGPVDGPYASVKPEGDGQRIGAEVFFGGSKQNAKGKRRNRRNRGLSRVRKPPSCPRLRARRTAV